MCPIEKRGKLQKMLNIHHLNPDRYDDLSNDDDFRVLCTTCHETVELWVRRILSPKFKKTFPTYENWKGLIYNFVTIETRNKLDHNVQTEKRKETIMPRSFGTKKEYEEPPFGTYPSRLIGIYDVGTQFNKQNNMWNKNPTIILSFALMGEERTSEGDFFCKDVWTNWTNHTNSGLFKILYSLGMKPMEVENMTKDKGGWYIVPKDFSFDPFLGAPCLSTVGPKESGEGAKINAISAIIKGMAVDKWEGNLINLDWTLPDFEETLSKVPEYIKNHLMNSKEIKIDGKKIEFSAKSSETFADDAPF